MCDRRESAATVGSFGNDYSIGEATDNSVSCQEVELLSFDTLFLLADNCPALL
jgi:hypothetical protein